jgi:hypothetical protein
MIYVTADKYQVMSLQKMVHHEIRERSEYLDWEPEDFLEAFEIIIIGTTPGDKLARVTMINACVKHINLLQQKPLFSALLEEHGYIGAIILYHKRLPLMLEGTWYCGESEHADAVPSCRKCQKSFPASFVRSQRHLKAWECPTCENGRGTKVRKKHPVCLDCRDKSGKHMVVRWEWRG